MKKTEMCPEVSSPLYNSTVRGSSTATATPFLFRANLVDARGCTAGHGGPEHAILGVQVYFHRGVATGVDDLAPHNLRDGRLAGRRTGGSAVRVFMEDVVSRIFKTLCGERVACWLVVFCVSFMVAGWIVERGGQRRVTTVVVVFVLLWFLFFLRSIIRKPAAFVAHVHECSHHVLSTIVQSPDNLLLCHTSTLRETRGMKHEQ